MKPKIYFNSLEFNDGTTINLESNSINILVGANNTGKSVALKNIQGSLSPNQATGFKVIVNAKPQTSVTTHEEFYSFFDQLRFNHLNNITLGIFPYTRDTLVEAWNKSNETVISNLGQRVLKFLTTERRISFSNSINSIDFYSEKPNHPIHFMFLDDKLESTISDYFRQAFNQDLVISRLGGVNIYVHIGKRPTISNGEDRMSKSFDDRIRKLDLLSNQGDGMRSFATILMELTSLENSTLFIDEPEAFLHPPQSRLLGKLIGKLFGERQIFIATHSSDFIKGLMESNNDKINIIRIDRKDGINKPSVLNSRDISEIWNDPTLRHSSIIDGLFHESVIICESDGDCRYFSTLLHAQYENHTLFYKIADTLFIPSHGKSKMPSIVKALKKISVPTYTICDFDICNNITPLRELIEAHGGIWKIFEPNWRIFKTAIDSLKSQLDKLEVKEKIDHILSSSGSAIITLKDVESIKSVLKISTAWSFAKTQGIGFVPAGDATRACVEFVKQLNQIGIFPLTVGELESFDRNIGAGNKAKWLEEVLAKDLKKDPSFDHAKEFLKILVKEIYDLD